MIMLADTILDGIEGQQSLGGLDIDVRRNAFGSQTDSFEVDLTSRNSGSRRCTPCSSGRRWSSGSVRAVHALAELDDGRVVAVEQGNLLATSFHPEMTDDHRFHEYFLDRVADVGFPG